MTRKVKIWSIVSVLIIIFLALMFFSAPGAKNSSLMAGLLGGAFGGRIISPPVPCIDEGGYLIVVGPPAGGTFYINPFTTRIYKNYNPATPNVWVIGKATPLAWVPCSDLGVPLGTGLYVEKIGTSFLPF